MIGWPLLRGLVDAVTVWSVRFYFDVSYRALSAPAGRHFLRRSAGPHAPAVHGYSTADDLHVLVAVLDPSPDTLLVDLGCGIGDVAIAIHRQTGCRVFGVDAAQHAVAQARRRAARAGAGAFVRFDALLRRRPGWSGRVALKLSSRERSPS